MKQLPLLGPLLVIIAFGGLALLPSSAQDQPADRTQSSESLGDIANKLKTQKGQTKPPGKTKVITNNDVPGASAAGGQGGMEYPLSISLPGKTWAVEIRGKGLSVDSNQPTTPRARRIMASDMARGLTVSVQLEEVDHQPTLDECRQYQRDRTQAFTGKFDLQDIKYWDDGKMAFVEYSVPEFQGKPVRQRSLFACSSKEDVFIDIHVSKVGFEPQDEPLLTSLMNAVHVTDRKAASSPGSASNSMQFFREGSQFYLHRQYQEAIQPYQKALDLEKKDRRLEKDFWRVLVDNLGMAYGITGDLKKAKETFEYGISQDRTYPMFYYNLACTYAEMNDLENAISNLKTAFENKENGIKGEGMPDPRSDDSFQRFMNNEKFRKLLNSLPLSSK